MPAIVHHVRLVNLWDACHTLDVCPCSCEEGTVRGLDSMPVVYADKRPSGKYNLPLTYILCYLTVGFNGGTTERVAAQRHVFADFGVSRKLTAAFHSYATSHLPYYFRRIAPNLSTAWRLGLTTRTHVSIVASSFSFRGQAGY